MGEVAGPVQRMLDDLEELVEYVRGPSTVVSDSLVAIRAKEAINVIRLQREDVLDLRMQVADLKAELTDRWMAEVERRVEDGDAVKELLDEAVETQRSWLNEQVNRVLYGP